MSLLRNACSALIRSLLIFGLAFLPLSQPMALAALAAPQQASAEHCPHHDVGTQAADEHEAQPGDCCCMNGAPCHCAMTVALTTRFSLMIGAPVSEHPVSAPSLAASVLPSPESPPPRA
jgi:hypothetical protein